MAGQRPRCCTGSCRRRAEEGEVCRSFEGDGLVKRLSLWYLLVLGALALLKGPDCFGKKRFQNIFAQLSKHDDGGFRAFFLGTGVGCLLWMTSFGLFLSCFPQLSS